MSAAFLAQFVAIGIYSYVLGSFMAPMSAELEWSRGDFTLSRSIGQIVMAMAGIFIGSLIDRIGPRPIMATGTVILSCALVLHSQIESLWAWWLLNGLVLTIGCAMIGNLVVNVTLSKWFVLNRGRKLLTSLILLRELEGYRDCRNGRVPWGHHYYPAGYLSGG